MKHMEVQDYHSKSKMNIKHNLRVSSNDKSFTIIHQEGYIQGSHFFIISLEDDGGIVAKSLNLEEAKQVVAYLNSHIILAENE